MRLTATFDTQKRSPLKVGNAGGASIPAPVQGWDTVSPLAAMDPQRAVQLENWIPRPGWIELRRGFGVQSATSTGAPVETLMPFNGRSASGLFAISDGTIYDVTSAAATATTVTGLTNSRAQSLMFTNASDNAQYLLAVNGADAPKIYNGTTWADTSITGTGVTQDNFINLTVHKGRLWFVETNSTTPCYMATVGAIAGTAVGFPLGSLMSRGGYVQAMGTWTIDTRQTVDEYIAFITSRGQVIVYSGTDPSTANTWELVGIYDIGPPIGERCFLRIAGDLLIISIDGILPMSQMLSTDRAAANRTSITSIIMNAMNLAAQSYRSNWGWQFVEYAKGTLAILNIPIVENQEQEQFVMNTLTGAWCNFTGINANCWAVDVNDKIYFGGNDGIVYQWDVGPSDYTENIIATAKTAFNYFGSRGRLKRWTMLQPLINSNGLVTPSIGINVDFRSDVVLSTPAVVQPAGALWDDAVWDVDLWPTDNQQSPNWITITGMGQCASVETQVSSGQNFNNEPAIWGVSSWGIGAWAAISTETVTLQLNGWNIVHERGGFV